MPLDELTMPLVHIIRLYQTVGRALGQVLWMEGAAPRRRTDTDPFEHFALTILQHPDMGTQLEPQEQGDGKRSAEYMRRIRANSWAAYSESKKMTYGPCLRT